MRPQVEMTVVISQSQHLASGDRLVCVSILIVAHKVQRVHCLSWKPRIFLPENLVLKLTSHQPFTMLSKSEPFKIIVPCGRHHTVIPWFVKGALISSCFSDD